MNVLILYTKDRYELFNRKSAIGSYIHCLASILNESEVNVFLNGEDFNQVNHNTKSHGDFQQSKIKQLISRLIPGFIKRLIRDFKHISSLKNFSEELLVSNNSYDAILEFYNFGSNVGYLVSKHFNIPLYITYDGPILEEYVFFNGAKPIFSNVILKREKKSLQAAKKIVVYSNPMIDFIKTKIGENDKLSIHQNVDFSRFDIMKNDKDYSSQSINICFVGSFLKWHQIDFLIDAFSECLKEGLDCKLFLIGDGMERLRMETYVDSLTDNVKHNIKFTGFLDGSDLFELKEKMHIGIMPGSNWYGAPNKIFEYGAMKMSVIAPNTPTITDLFNEEEVMFFKWKDKQSLTEKLIDMVSNTSKIKSFASNLNTYILNKYSSENTSSFYTKLLND